MRVEAIQMVSHQLNGSGELSSLIVSFLIMIQSCYCEWIIDHLCNGMVYSFGGHLSVCVSCSKFRKFILMWGYAYFVEFLALYIRVIGSRSREQKKRVCVTTLQAMNLKCIDLEISCLAHWSTFTLPSSRSWGSRSQQQQKMWVVPPWVRRQSCLITVVWVHNGGKNVCMWLQLWTWHHERVWRGWLHSVSNLLSWLKCR